MKLTAIQVDHNYHRVREVEIISYLPGHPVAAVSPLRGKKKNTMYPWPVTHLRELFFVD